LVKFFQTPAQISETLAGFGIVSRANLVQALASARKEIKAAAATSDRMIREELLSRLRKEPWARTSRLTAELTPGVRVVNDNLIVESVASASQLATA
jgi:hypothetical protein